MGLNCPHGAVPKGHQKFSHSLQEGLRSTLSGCQVSVSVYLLFSTLPRRNSRFPWFTTLFGPFWWVWGNNSIKQHQIELKLWPTGVLIVVQMPFKVFWKPQFFTEIGNTQNSSFWPNFDHSLPSEDGQNQKLAIRLCRSVKIKALSPFIFH